MKRMLMIATLASFSLLGRLAFAEGDAKPPHGKPGEGGRPHMPPEELFKKIDTNGDGSLSLDEIKASPRGSKDPAKAEEMFKKKDKNGDGKLSLDEFKHGFPPGGPRGDRPGEGGGKPPHGEGKRGKGDK